MNVKLFSSSAAGYAAFLLMSCAAPARLSGPELTSQTVPVQHAPVTSSNDTTQKADADPFFTGLFDSYPGTFDYIRSHKELNVQIIYTRIDRDRNGDPHLQHFYYNQEGPAYFYPASTVKLPVALLALQKIAGLQQTGITRNSAMVHEKGYSGQTAAYNDPNTKDGQPNISQYIKKIFLVSDNDAFNRLYEFAGQEYINNALQKMGYKDAQILHRLDVWLTEDENRHTNPVNFYGSSGQLLYEQPMQESRFKFLPRKDLVGQAYYSNGKLIRQPMNLSQKNRLPLKDLHNILQALVFPSTVPAAQRFNISDDDRLFVLKYMSQYPRESLYPSYDSTMGDGYAKQLMFGDEKGSIPSGIRVFNKSGTGYGQLTDISYVTDVRNNIEFMVSAAIYCNSDGILNDDRYEYESIGYPFMKNLGKALYNYEARRKKNYLPDLSPFIFSYDK